jgi:CobQ-like glutamine amidotransferase family enzyme
MAPTVSASLPRLTGEEGDRGKVRIRRTRKEWRGKHGNIAQGEHQDKHTNFQAAIFEVLCVIESPKNCFQ